MSGSFAKDKGSIMETPAFYAIIPANIRYSKDLEMGAKLLYGEITALSNAYGYCWATNRYFSELYDVDQSTIKRWIKSLKDVGFIKIEIEKKGIQTLRKIWISHEIQKSFTKAQKCADGGAFLGCRGVKIELQNNTSINTENKEIPPNPLKGEMELYGKFVQLTKEELVSLTDQFGRQEVIEIMNEINDYLASTGKNPYKDYTATIRNWMRRRKNSANPLQTVANENKQFAKKVCEKLQHPDIEIFQENIRFINRAAGSDLFIAFKSSGFKDQVIGRLKKMNLPTEGLF